MQLEQLRQSGSKWQVCRDHSLCREPRLTGRPQEGQSGRDTGLLGQGVVSRGRPRARFCPAGPAQGCWASRGCRPGCRQPAACGVGCGRDKSAGWEGTCGPRVRLQRACGWGAARGPLETRLILPDQFSMWLLRETLPRTEPSSEAGVPAASGPSAPGQLSGACPLGPHRTIGDP